MLSKHNPIQHDQIEMIALDQLIPTNHLNQKNSFELDKEHIDIVTLFVM